jgi:hypothetical protein
MYTIYFIGTAMQEKALKLASFNNIFEALQWAAPQDMQADDDAGPVLVNAAGRMVYYYTFEDGWRRSSDASLLSDYCAV